MLNSSKGAREASKKRMRNSVMMESQRSYLLSFRVQQAADWTSRAHHGINSRTTGATKVRRKEEK